MPKPELKADSCRNVEYASHTLDDGQYQLISQIQLSIGKVALSFLCKLFADQFLSFDNIDQNTWATTGKMIFHETIFSFHQYPTPDNHDNKNGSECILNTEVMSKKWIDIISQSYTQPWWMTDSLSRPYLMTSICEIHSLIAKSVAPVAKHAYELLGNHNTVRIFSPGYMWTMDWFGCAVHTHTHLTCS